MCAWWWRFDTAGFCCRMLHIKYPQYWILPEFSPDAGSSSRLNMRLFAPACPLDTCGNSYTWFLSLRPKTPAHLVDHEFEVVTQCECVPVRIPFYADAYMWRIVYGAASQANTTPLMRQFYCPTPHICRGDFLGNRKQ